MTAKVRAIGKPRLAIRQTEIAHGRSRILCPAYNGLSHSWLASMLVHIAILIWLFALCAIFPTHPKLQERSHPMVTVSVRFAEPQPVTLAPVEEIPLVNEDALPKLADVTPAFDDARTESAPELSEIEIELFTSVEMTWQAPNAENAGIPEFAPIGSFADLELFQGKKGSIGLGGSSESKSENALAGISGQPSGSGNNIGGGNAGVTPNGRSKGTSRPARLASAISPEYPERLRKSGKTGTVLLSIELDPSGRVAAIEILSKDSSPEFISAAVDAVKRAQFDCALEYGTPVVGTITVRVVFRLD